MLKSLFIVAALVATLSANAAAQNTNTGTTGSAPAGTRRPAPTQEATPAPAQTPAQRTPAARGARPSADAAQARAVRDAFDSLIDGIRRADAAAVTKLYWNSPQLLLFNNNGTVTRSWEQSRSNRESLYAKVSDVKLDVRDVRVKTLGPSAAVVTCLWEQSQTADGQPERATGRLTLVFQKIGAEWKAVHAHTSPDRPDPSRLLPSERTTPDASPKPPPAKP